MKTKMYPLKHIMNITLGRTILIVLLAITIVESLHFFYTSYFLYQKNQNILVELVYNAIREPIEQGGFVEANRRLVQMMHEKYFFCAKLTAWDFNVNYCDQKKDKYNIEKVKEIKISHDNQKIGEVHLYFELKDYLYPVFFKVFLDLLLIICIGYGLRFFYQKNFKKIYSQLDKIVENISNKNVPTEKNDYNKKNQYEIFEFQLVAEKIQQQVQENLELSKQAAIARTTQMLAHDVRKPFTILKGIISVLGDTKDQTEIQDRLPSMLDDVQRSITTVDGLINDVLEIGRTSSLTTVETNPQTLIDITLLDLSKIFLDADIEIHYELSDLNYVNIDSTRVLRVFLNIVNNAIEAMKEMESNKKIWFKTTFVEVKEKYFLEFRLGNNGPVIPEKYLGELFEAFFTKNKSGGTGLGLAIAKKVVEAHGGAIHCESSLKLGTEFIFTLPALKDKIADKIKLLDKLSDYNKQTRTLPNINIKDEESRIERTLVSKFANITQKTKILLVDDEAIYRETLINLLKKNTDIFNNLEILEASNSDEALTIIESPTPPQIVILDIDLGKNSLNGIDIAATVQAKGYSGKICIHSNRFLSSIQISGLNVNKITRKPMERKDFLELILSTLPDSEIKTVSAIEANNPTKSFSIAIIEDNNSLMYFMKRQINPYATVAEYPTPEAFLNDFHNTNFNLIITDQNFEPLSKEKGLDFAKRLREEFKYNKPIVLASLEDFPPEMLKGIVDATIDKNMFSWKNIENLLPKNKVIEIMENVTKLPLVEQPVDLSVLEIQEQASPLASELFDFARNKIPHEKLSETDLSLMSRLVHDLRSEVGSYMYYMDNLEQYFKTNNKILFESLALSIEKKCLVLKPFLTEAAFVSFTEKIKGLILAPQKIESKILQEIIYALLQDIGDNQYYKINKKVEVTITQVKFTEPKEKNFLTIVINDIEFKNGFQKLIQEQHPNLLLNFKHDLQSSFIVVTDDNEFFNLARNEKIPTYLADPTDPPEELVTKVTRTIKQLKNRSI